MRRVLLGFATAAILIGTPTTTSAQVISNLCWNVSGLAVKGSLTAAGSAGGTAIFSFDGIGIVGTTGIPLKGTFTVPPTGNIRFSYLLLQAGSTHAVVHDLSLSRTTLSGTGNFRWFDSTNSGTNVATFVSCASVAEPAAGDPRAHGSTE